LPARRPSIPLMAADERRFLLAAGDLVVVGLIFILTLKAAPWLARWTMLSLESWQWSWLLILDLTWALVALCFGCYDLRRTVRPAGSLPTTAAAALCTAIVYFFIPRVTAPFTTSRALMFFLAGGLVIALCAWRLLFATVMSRAAFRRRVLILGTGASAREIASVLQADSRHEYELAGFVTLDDSLADGAADSNPAGPTIGDIDQLLESAPARGVDELVLSTSYPLPADLQRKLVALYEAGIQITPMAQLYEQLTGRVPVEHVGSYWMVTLPQHRVSLGYTLAKRAFDVVLACLGLLGTAIILPFIALAIRLNSPGPIFYSQERVGELGKVFRLLKFRSMVADAEQNGQAVWAQKGDSRITPVGRFLRATRLDELPQFWNVLRGDMSVIGPRPERPQFVEMLEQEIPFYRSRLFVKPGLGGWAQVNYRYGSSVHDALIKLQYDLYYVKHQSLVLDLVIAWRTLGVMLRFKGT
ncbi:MAG TPA: sugar transferase, partial [Chloroflexota bacterium]|nr:sugar transferase [Chloroflexota bacterium]